MPRRIRKPPEDPVAKWVYHLSHSRVAFTVDLVAHYAKCSVEAAEACVKAGVSDGWCYKTQRVHAAQKVDLYVGKL